MIWLISLILIGIAAWLILNGINEKQWVDAHLHDETVASDKGLFHSFSGLTEGDGEDKVANVVKNVKERSADAKVKITEKVSEKINEAKQTDAAGKLMDKTSGIRERVRTEVTSETGLVNKVKQNVTAGVEKAAAKVDEKIVNRKS